MFNIFSAVILAAVVLEFVLDTVADMLNLRCLNNPVPSQLQGLYDPAAYQKSQEYTRVSTRFGFISRIFRLALLLVFWFAGGFGWLEGLVVGWGFPVIVSGVLYIGILLTGYEIITLPFGIYATFGLEARFGFNKTTPRTYLADLLKGAALAVVLGVPLLAAVLALFEYAGPWAWFYCWVAVTVFQVIVQFVAPTWIMPLFNKFKPLPPGDLRDAILAYANSVQFPLNNVFVMDGSKRSTRGNAFFTGFGRNRRIALFDTLIAKHTVPELVAVLAHEIGHYKKKHIILGMVFGIVNTGVIFFLLSIFLRSTGLYQAFYMPDYPIYAGLLFFGFLYAPLELALSLVMNSVSRLNERQADRFAAETISRPADLAEGLKKLSRDNLANLTPHPFYVFLHYSHPPLLERVRNIEQVTPKSTG